MDWSSICKMMRNAPRQSEMAYQTYIKDIILEIGLGWKSYQINEQLSLQLGSTERLVPDILVRKDANNSFIIEVKKPGHKKSNGNIEQLLSYMKQLETPVGLYWGDELYVYYKTIGDGSAPILLMKLNFYVLNEDGDKFVSLFSADNYCIDSILKYKDDQAAKLIFESKVNDLLSEVTSKEFQGSAKTIIGSYLINQGIEEDVVKTVMEKVLVSVLFEKKTNESDAISLSDSNRGVLSGNKIRANRGTAQRFAYELIRQIIEKNPDYNFEQLFAIFRKKNHIEKVSQINDWKRWCMAEEDIITLLDGTKVAISNQWGFNGASKPRMDNLREIAKGFGIDVTLPQ